MSDMMRAQYYDRYGTPDEVLQLREIAKPSPGPGEVLVKVHSTSAQPLDWHLITGEPRLLRLQMGLRTKRHIPGADIAGWVEEVGAGVTALGPGDEVFGETAGGGFAEYVVTRESRLTLKPAGVTFEEAAAVPVAALTALQGLRDWGRLKAGDDVLIIGASGGVGTFAVQIAKTMGARVTAVCSTHNVETAERLGADIVVDYSKADYAATENRYDVILDVPGNRDLLTLRRLLKPTGSYVGIGGPKGRWVGPIPRLLRMFAVAAFGGRRMTFGVEKLSAADLGVMAAWLDEGSVTPVIDRNYKLDEAVDALMYIGQRHARGKVVVTM